MKTGKARLTVSDAVVVEPAKAEILRLIIAAMDYYAYVGNKWACPEPEAGLYWLCWQKLKEWETPQAFLKAHSATYRNQWEQFELLELYSDANALPVDLSLFYIDEAGALTIMEDTEVDVNLSELLAFVLSDFVQAGALFEVRPSNEENPEVWAYRVVGPGSIEGLSLAWVNHEHEWIAPYVPL